jgi:hypothetical protein
MGVGNKIITRGFGAGRSQIITRGYEGRLVGIVPMVIINLVARFATTLNLRARE